MATPVIISTNGYGTPVVSVASGGLPVSTATNGYGSPVVIATNGYGTPVTFDNRAVLLAGSYLSAVTLSFPDNYLIIRDPVTPANNYNGPLITAGAFNKFTYTRASTATFVGSNGLIQTAASGVPRIEYDPVTLAVKGYMHEGARTNLCLQSGDLTQAVWSKSDTTITPNATTSIFGTTTMALLTEGVGGSAQILENITIVANTTYTVSFYAKLGNTPFIELVWGAGVNGLALWANLATGVLGTVTTFGAGGPVLTGSSIKNVGGGIYKITLTGIADSATTTGYIAFHSASADANGTRVNNATYYLDGVQLEQAGAASSYIPTTTVAVTRAADACSLAGTSFNLTQTAGTLYAKNTWQGGTAVSSSGRGVISANDGTTNNYETLTNAGAVPSFVGINATVVQQILATPATADGVFNKLAGAYAAGDTSFVKDGGTPATGVGSPPTTTTLTLGDISSGFPLFGTIQEAAFIGQRITNAAMQGLTT